MPFAQWLVGEPTAVKLPLVAVGGFVEGGEGGPVIVDQCGGHAVGEIQHIEVICCDAPQFARDAANQSVPPEE